MSHFDGPSGENETQSSGVLKGGQIERYDLLDPLTECGGEVMRESERFDIYQSALDGGLTDHEARELAWPSESPDAQRVTSDDLPHSGSSTDRPDAIPTGEDPRR